MNDKKTVKRCGVIAAVILAVLLPVIGIPLCTLSFTNLSQLSHRKIYTKSRELIYPIPSEKIRRVKASLRFLWKTLSTGITPYIGKGTGAIICDRIGMYCFYGAGNIEICFIPLTENAVSILKAEKTAFDDFGEIGIIQ